MRQPLGVTTWLIDWCAATEARLAREGPAEVEI
jgi:hypothetical protein